MKMIIKQGKWKQTALVPTLKPGKDASDPASYRPTALTRGDHRVYVGREADTSSEV